MVRFSASMTMGSSSFKRAIGPPACASGVMCPMINLRDAQKTDARRREREERGERRERTQRNATQRNLTIRTTVRAMYQAATSVEIQQSGYEKHDGTIKPRTSELVSPSNESINLKRTEGRNKYLLKNEQLLLKRALPIKSRVVR